MVDAPGRREKTLRVGDRGLAWRFLSKTCSKSWGTVSSAMDTFTGGRVPMKTKCRRVLSHVFSTPLGGSVNWPECHHAGDGAFGRLKFCVSPFDPRCMREKAGLVQAEDSSLFQYQMQEMGPADVVRKNGGQILDDYELVYLSWRGSDHEGFALYSGMENHVMVAERQRMGYEQGPGKRDKMEAQMWVSQQTSAAGQSDVEVGGKRERLDTAYG